MSNEKLRRLQQIAGCRVQIAKSFKTQGPPLPWFLSDLNLRNFYIAALLRQRLTVQWFFIGLQRDFDDTGTRRVIGANPSRFLDDHSFGHFERGLLEGTICTKVQRKAQMPPIRLTATRPLISTPGLPPRILIEISDWSVWERYSSIRNFPPPGAGDISPNQRCKLAGHSSG